MPTRKQTLSILITSAAFVAGAVVAANLNHFETTKFDLTQNIAGGDVPGVTVAWVTDFDSQLGDDKIVGATLVPKPGTDLDNSTVEITIVGVNGLDLGTMSSDDGGATWTGLDETVPVGATLDASVVINDRETIAAISNGQ